MAKRKQSRLLTIKIVILIVVAAVCMVVMGFLLAYRQTDLYVNSYTTEMSEVFAELPETIADANIEVARDTANFNETYQSYAQVLAFMANNNTGFRRTTAKMQEYRDLLGVDNVLVVSKEGTILTQAQRTKANFASSRFNELRTVFDTGEPSGAVDIEIPSKDWLMRYYSARIDDNTMIVVEQNPAELRVLTETNGSLKSMLEGIDIGQSGFIFAVSALDYVVDYFPDPELVGTDALAIGVYVGDLEDGNFCWMTIGDETYYCGVCKIDNEYYIAAVPQADMRAARNLTVAVILFAFFVVMAVVIMYGIFVMRENERNGTSEDDVVRFGPLTINKVITKKAAVLAFVGFLAILVVSFYMQTLFALSSQSVSNNDRVDDIVENIENSEERMEELSEEYGQRYLPICYVIGYALDANPALLNRTDLQSLADILHVQSILVYNNNGKLQATNSAYEKYELSENESDPTYEFIKLLQGEIDYVVQDPTYDDITGDLWQYIGVPIHDENGFVDGLVQIAIRPTFLQSLLSSADIETVLSGVKVGSNGFAFAINKDDDTFAYYPVNERYTGQSALDHGMTREQIKDRYNDYLTLDGDTYYAASAETGRYYIYIAGNSGELMQERVPLTVATGIVAFICLLLIFLLLIIEPEGNLRSDESEDGSDRFIDTVMPSGRVVRTESASSRWANVSVSWNERSAWQKTTAVLQVLMAILVVVVCVAVVFKDRFFDSDSIFSYILGNDWERGLNVFAITACLMFICVAATAVTIVQQILHILSTILSARGETICRLMSSFVKYATLIGMVYYALLLIGIDGTTLLASAGILSIAVSLGARDLVEDILSGLFIIFEGEFRVGDIITVGDWRGTVLEIGVRTTKVEEPGQNVKVIRNSDMNNVINMTRKLSYVSADYAIEYGESLEHVEAILAKELPLIPERLPAIVNGPFYRGVSSLGDSSVQIRISMQCLEKDRMQLGRDFNREMRLIFDRYNINIPFPQIVVHEPFEDQKATPIEKIEAEEFNEEQKEETKNMDEEIQNPK